MNSFFRGRQGLDRILITIGFLLGMMFAMLIFVVVGIIHALTH